MPSIIAKRERIVKHFVYVFYGLLNIFQKALAFFANLC